MSKLPDERFKSLKFIGEALEEHYRGVNFFTGEAMKINKLPDELCKLRDSVKCVDPDYDIGFNDGAEAMRTYMQAEAGKLLEALIKSLKTI